MRRQLQIVLALVLGMGMLAPAWGQEFSRPRIGNTSASLAAAESLSQAFESASNRIIPAVVKLRTTTSGRQRVMINGFLPMEVPDQEGLGSGVIIDESGIIMTNNHVVKDADEVIVVLHDGTELYATEYTADPLTDLAIVRVKTKERLPVARFGDSDNLQVGDWVLAVGHPLELETSVSAGIISAKGRSLLDKIPRAQFLQTDAAINPGNSGGPLVNLRGEVVGLNTAIASQTGGYQGIGFAVPGNLVKQVVRQLRDEGEVSRGYLGVSIQQLTKDLARQLLDRPEYSGVLINDVKVDTPAERAGLQPGDVITHFARIPVDSPQKLQLAVERVPVGSNQRLDFVRFRKPMTASIKTLQIQQEQFGSKYQNRTKRLSIPVRNNNSLGFEVADLSEIARRNGIQVDQDAVVITRVGRDSLASEKGLSPGMIIKQVRNQSIDSVDDFNAALRNESLADGILLLVRDTSQQGIADKFVVVRAYQ